MGEWPGIHAVPPGGMITTRSVSSLFGPHNNATSVAFPAENLAIFEPFRIGAPFTVTGVRWRNGSTVNGNVDVGVYSADGTRLVSTGSTAQSGISAVQEVSVGPITIGPGLFYLALASSSITTTFMISTWHATPASLGWRMDGCAQMASAFPLPATATFASMAHNYVPFIATTGTVS